MINTIDTATFRATVIASAQSAVSATYPEAACYRRTMGEFYIMDKPACTKILGAGPSAIRAWQVAAGALDASV